MSRCVTDAPAPAHDRDRPGPLTVPHPAVSLSSFGLGGGSIIRRAAARCASARRARAPPPGPACFGLGGELLTPTDVWLLLGYIDPGEFLGGRRGSRSDRAREAGRGRGSPALGRSRSTALLRARAAVHAALADGCAPGRAPSRSWLLSRRGGSLAVLLRRRRRTPVRGRRGALWISRRVVVFPNSSVFSAFGGGLLPIAHHYRVVAPARPRRPRGPTGRASPTPPAATFAPRA